MREYLFFDIVTISMLGKDISNNLEDFVKQTLELIRIEPKMNESNTKFKIIEPLLKLLGWDFRFDIRLEYPVKVGTTTPRVDYALMIDGNPVVLVEAKGLDSEIERSHAEQAISYGRYEEIKWVVITNGRSIAILNTGWGKDYYNCLFEKVDIEDIPKRIDTLLLLSKDAMRSREIDRIAAFRFRIQQLIRKLLNNKESISREIASIIERYGDDALHHRIFELSAKALDILISDLEEISEPPPPDGPAVPEIYRKDIDAHETDEIAVFPSQEDGITFLEKYNAWGFVKMKRKPRFIAFYFAKPHSAILYFAEIESISNPIMDRSEIRDIEENDIGTFKPGRQIVRFKPNSLIELLDPIPLGQKGMLVRGLLYTTFAKFRTANTTKDIL